MCFVARASEMGRGSLQGRVSVQEPRIAVRKPLRAGRQTSGAPVHWGPDVDGAGRSPPTPTGRKVSKGAGRPAPLLSTQTLEANGLRG